MNPKILLRVTAPTVVIGVLLFGACLISIGYISQLQTNLTHILSQNVASLQAAQELEIRVRQLRHHNLLYLMAPNPDDDLKVIRTEEQQFKEALEVARQASNTDQERSWVRAIADGYKQYEQEQDRLRADTTPNRSTAEFRKLIDSHPIHFVVDPCEALVRANKEQMEATARESLRVSWQASWAMLLIGLAGPVGGPDRGLRHGARPEPIRLPARRPRPGHGPAFGPRRGLRPGGRRRPPHARPANANAGAARRGSDRERAAEPARFAAG